MRRMRLIDQHWISEPSFARKPLTRWEQLKLALVPGVEVVFLDGLHEPIDERAVARRKVQLGLEESQYVLLCPGGGGMFGGVSAVPAFLAAARGVVEKAAFTTLLVAGPNSDLGEEGDGLLRIARALPNGDLMGLVRDAALAVTTGGTLMLQSLMQGTACVAAPIAKDQPHRIAACARRGLVRPAQLSGESLAAEVLDLLSHPEQLGAIRREVRAASLRNGVEVAVGALARLLGRG
jgi:hypothetical protein